MKNKETKVTKKSGKVLGRSIETLEAPKEKKVTIKEVKEVETKANTTELTSKEIPVEINPTTFTKSFDHPIRTYWNRRFERENSSCAKPGTPLEFEQINVRKDGVIEYRVRRGKRNFFTTSYDMKPQEV